MSTSSNHSSMNPMNLIGSRLCYERVKVREQTRHYQRLLEIRPTIEFFGAARHSVAPVRQSQQSMKPEILTSAGQPIQSKKERLVFERERDITKGN